MAVEKYALRPTLRSFFNDATRNRKIKMPSVTKQSEDEES
jgi:hypothetical protein